MTGTRSLIVVDDNLEVRAMLRALLAAQSALELVGEASDGTTAIEICRALRPDVVVVDTGLPDLTGHALITALRRVSPRTGIVVFTGSAASANRARGLGVHEVLTKGDADLRTLLAAIERAAVVLEVSAEYAPDVVNIGPARRFVADTLRLWECDAFIEDVSLAVSELATNAVMHAGTPFVVRLVLDSGGLRIEVTDQGGGMPEPREPDTDGPGGRGLSIVGELAAAWGIEPHTADKTVWAYFRHHPRQLESQLDRTGQS